MTHDGFLTTIPGFWMVLPALPVGWWIWQRGADGRIDRRTTLMALLALVHVTGVIAMTIFPIPVAGQEFYRLTRGLSEDNYIPFHTIADQLVHMSLSSIRQLGGNMLALAPLGIYGPALWPRLRDWRWFVVTAVAFGVSIELTQLAGSLLEGFTYRVTDIDDAFMNAIGAVLAFLIWRKLENREPFRGLLERVYAG